MHVALTEEGGAASFNIREPTTFTIGKLVPTAIRKKKKLRQHGRAYSAIWTTTKPQPQQARHSEGSFSLSKQSTSESFISASKHVRPIGLSAGRWIHQCGSSNRIPFFPCCECMSKTVPLPPPVSSLIHKTGKHTVNSVC